MNRLEGKVVLITGAKGGLGTTVTGAFLDAGAAVAGASRSIADSDFPHGRFMAIPAELSSVEAARGLLDAALRRAGRVDVVVHLVGAWAGGRAIEETDEATLDRMLDLNLKPAFYLAAAAVPAMKEQGSGKILAIGSRSAVEPAALSAAYNASKAALVMLIRTLASEHGNDGISANIVLPGTMDTPANRSANPAADFSKWVQPEQVAAMLVHLASDEARQVNGAVIPIYGGEA
jgi:NAD(P)-dependent dehydrogenase (short-subunit alcohol dehydrogenase family)